MVLLLSTRPPMPIPCLFRSAARQKISKPPVIISASNATPRWAQSTSMSSGPSRKLPLSMPCAVRKMSLFSSEPTKGSRGTIRWRAIFASPSAKPKRREILADLYRKSPQRKPPVFSVVLTASVRVTSALNTPSVLMNSPPAERRAKTAARPPPGNPSLCSALITRTPSSVKTPLPCCLKGPSPFAFTPSGAGA